MKHRKQHPRPAGVPSDGRPAEALFDRGELHGFGEGTHCRLYNVLGAQRRIAGGREGFRFSVWAPAARRISLIGDFNGWSVGKHALKPVGRTGIWSTFVPELPTGSLYKYHLLSKLNDYEVAKSDPFAFRSQTPPDTASVTWDLRHGWRDEGWLQRRRGVEFGRGPMSIYELHLGSWKRAEGKLPTYRELTSSLIPYLLEMGFTHVEFLPPKEHPFYGSWGYQTTGYFAATSRYGEPQELMQLIDELHRNGIGVIVDWVASHFPRDEHGLVFFDGTHLYEHADPRQGHHPDWQSAIFNYGSGPVRSFLLSSAMFWLDRYHADGLRVDAVASMLYRNYSRKDGEWVPNKYGGPENLEAISLLRTLNDAVHRNFPGACTIAEESTTWPGVSRPAKSGGLGFDMKWDMGWMHDTLDYMALDPVHRRANHDKLTFRLMYAFSENFVLPMSHDEVVHGKGSLIGKMPGDAWQQFANLRLLYGYMYSQPGKKLIFMGSEFAQWREWDHERELDWNLLQYPLHRGVQRWVGDLNRIHREEPALHDLDFSDSGFRWLDCNDAAQSVLCYLRRSPLKGRDVLIACNFTPVPRHNYRVGVPSLGRWKELLNGDAEIYGGSGQGNLGGCDAVSIRYHEFDYSLLLTLPPLAAVYLALDSKPRPIKI